MECGKPRRCPPAASCPLVSTLAQELACPLGVSTASCSPSASMFTVLCCCWTSLSLFSGQNCWLWDGKYDSHAKKCKSSTDYGNYPGIINTYTLYAASNIPWFQLLKHEVLMFLFAIWFNSWVNMILLTCGLLNKTRYLVCDKTDWLITKNNQQITWWRDDRDTWIEKVYPLWTMNQSFACFCVVWRHFWPLRTRNTRKKIHVNLSGKSTDAVLFRLLITSSSLFLQQ